MLEVSASEGEDEEDDVDEDDMDILTLGGAEPPAENGAQVQVPR